MFACGINPYHGISAGRKGGNKDNPGKGGNGNGVVERLPTLIWSCDIELDAEDGLTVVVEVECGIRKLCFSRYNDSACKISKKIIFNNGSAVNQRNASNSSSLIG